MDVTVIAQSGGLSSPDRLNILVESFIQAQDVKPNSRLLYRRTLKTVF